jgi:large subunit ribosomal protein L3
MLGLIGKKIGMTQVFDEGGNLIPVTVIKVEPNVVVGSRGVDKDGYSAVVLGTGTHKRANKPYAGQFPDNMKPVRTLREFRDFGREVKVGEQLGVEIFEGAHFVDVQGVSKGKGYQGVMKRHGFGGGRKSHGSKFHRAGGSTGMAASPSKVIKGTKMAGRMGGENKTVQNLKVIKVDTEKQTLTVMGAVPGRNSGRVLVTLAKKK